MRRILLFVAFALSLPLLEVQESQAALAPASVSLGLGYSNQLGPVFNSYTPVPSASALWHLASHVSVYTKASYLQQRYLDDPVRATNYVGIEPYYSTKSATLRNHFLPIGAGIRLSAENTTGSHGVFVEAGPAAFLTSWSLDRGGTERGVLAGFQAGAGVRFLALGGAHGELGMSYYRSERADDPEAYGFTTGGGRVALQQLHGVETYTLYAGIGFGR